MLVRLCGALSVGGGSPVFPRVPRASGNYLASNRAVRERKSRLTMSLRKRIFNVRASFTQIGVVLMLRLWSCRALGLLTPVPFRRDTQVAAAVPTTQKERVSPTLESVAHSRTT